jgi:excisionase family DNA binding protein
MPSTKRPQLLTEYEAADILRVTVNCLRDWRSRPRDGVVPFIKLGRLVRYDAADLDEFLRKGRQTAPQ